jgi:hypothetical protein
MGLSPGMAIVLKRSTKLFFVFCGALAATGALAFFLDLVGTNFEKNFAFWALALMLWPAVITRRVLDDVPQEGYVYLSSIGMLDILGLAILYFLVCLVLAWFRTWTASIKSANKNTKA